MAYGPIFPQTAIPISTSCFANIHAATNAHAEGLGVAASIGSDATWRLWFQMPPALPSGTPKLRLLGVANAATNAAKVNPKWKSWAPEETVSSPTLNAEGTSTVTWSTGDNDQWKETLVTLDADTVVAGELIHMDLVFETSGWTLAVVSTWMAAIIFE